MRVRSLIHAYPPRGQGVTVPVEGCPAVGSFLLLYSQREINPVQVERHGCVRTTDDGRGQISRGPDELNSSCGRLWRHRRAPLLTGSPA